MSFLHTELAKLKAAIGGAFNFADPEAYIAEKEAAFKRSIADAVASLEERVEALEGKAPTADPVAPAPVAPPQEAEPVEADAASAAPAVASETADAPPDPTPTAEPATTAAPAA